MPRLACVDIPALPLQLLQRRQPGWEDAPCAVIAADKPQADILWVNPRARQQGILPGMRYAAGLSLCSDFRAGVVSALELQRALESLTSLLRELGPDVEPCEEAPGVFWLDASGLVPLHRSLRVWAEKVRTRLARERFHCGVVVGFSKFGSYASARADEGRGLRVFSSPEEELRTARQTPLLHLDLEGKELLALRQLGVEKLDELMRLPSAGVLRRFGPRVRQLQRLASGKVGEPLRPELAEPMLCQHIELGTPSLDARRLLTELTPALEALLARLAARSQGLAELELELQLEAGSRADSSARPLGEAPRRLCTRLRPSRASLDQGLILELLRLRLQNLQLQTAVEELRLQVYGVALRPEQLELFSSPQRDLAAADRALARLRARFGPEAVVCARVVEAHLPEERFGWQPLQRLRPAQPQETARARSIRRFFLPAIPLSPRLELPERWLEHRIRRGSIVRCCGPYPVSGKWWAEPVERRYLFLQTRAGAWLWVYCDQRVGRWFLAARVM